MTYCASNTLIVVWEDCPCPYSTSGWSEDKPHKSSWWYSANVGNFPPLGRMGIMSSAFLLLLNWSSSQLNTCHSSQWAVYLEAASTLRLRDPTIVHNWCQSTVRDVPWLPQYLQHHSQFVSKGLQEQTGVDHHLSPWVLDYLVHSTCGFGNVSQTWCPAARGQRNEPFWLHSFSPYIPQTSNTTLLWLCNRQPHFHRW